MTRLLALARGPRPGGVWQIPAWVDPRQIDQWVRRWLGRGGATEVEIIGEVA